MAKITNEQKLEALKGWLKENGIEYVENYESKRFGVHIDVKIPSLRIAIFNSTGDKDWEAERYAATTDFQKLLFQFYKPFFVRPKDTKAFTLEKIQNCCYDQFMRKQRAWQRREEAKGKKEVL